MRDCSSSLGPRSASSSNSCEHRLWAHRRRSCQTRCRAGPASLSAPLTAPDAPAAPASVASSEVYEMTINSPSLQVALLLLLLLLLLHKHLCLQGCCVLRCEAIGAVQTLVQSGTRASVWPVSAPAAPDLDHACHRCHHHRHHHHHRQQQQQQQQQQLLRSS